MIKQRSLSKSILLLVAVCWLVRPSAAGSQTTVTIMEPTTSIPTACVVTIIKVGLPNLTSPTSFVYIRKHLDTSRNCNRLMSNNADSCIPAMGTTNMLIASAFRANLTMNPSCQWYCAGCGTITTDAANDGLPVELMGFSIDEEGTEEEEPEGESRPEG